MELAQSSLPADHISAAQYPAGQEVSSSTSRTPTSNYGNPPHSAPSGSFLQNAQRPSYHANGTSRGGMAHRQNTSSMTQPNGRSHQTCPVKSDNNAPTDPPIAAPHTTYASYGQNSTQAPSPEMTHSYSYPSGGMYALPRPDWPGYVQHGGEPLTLGPPAYAPNPASTSSQTRPSNGYSFVQVPSVPEKKRTRRRPDQIDRIYKCGWNDCDKAYGTLNHLNAHVTMQSHGQKRVPGEFKKIREEWRQRKKKEEANPNPERERQRQAATVAAAQNGFWRASGTIWHP
ncbi:hypothetical protein AU210_016393 [Fusarium oxysporum f. sp. radicis-cucumerinum]|uniref:C2H2-type domain-containing protein n=1 Tax=Fusarium oxysporum f. sp. radicis-cucumerinum TaxID=327505 RepID=A0A2H3FSW3_FUSOX|nr:hypothetical protein AU210_016393 [Fusarium oxysporum f. sp. radicis-cucumerinum]